MAGKKILVIDADAASRNFVARALQHEGHHALQAGSGKEGLIAAWRDRPDLIVIDPVLADLKGEDLALKLRQDTRTEGTLLIALSSDPQAGRVKACLDAGFDEYLVKSGQAMQALVEAINRLLGVTAAAAKVGGLLIVFLSAKGGTGTSSLCANIAMTIAQERSGARLVVVDMILPIGSIASIVGYDGPQNLVTVADMPPEEANSDFFRDHLTEMAAWRFHVLAGSPDPESANLLKVGRIGEIVSTLKSVYDYVIIDLGRSLSRISLPLIQHADLLALIVSTDLMTVTPTKTLWDYLQSKGVEASSVYTILNRAVGLEGLTKAEAEKILGIEIKTAMPYLGGNFALANNQHQPFSLKFPKDTASVVLRETAQQMVELAHRLRTE